MPQIFKIGSYVVYFWINEGKHIQEIIEARNAEVCRKWYETFGEIRYYC